MTNDELAALDCAATQGDSNALTDLEMALVNLYRTGKLVLIGPDAVERAGFAIWHKLKQIEDEVRDLATAATAATAALKGSTDA
jgi:hypothetical protein